MSKSNLFYSVSESAPVDAKGRERSFKPASVPAAILRLVAAKGPEVTLPEVIEGFAASYLSENRELPRSGVLRDNPELYFFDYLKFLVKEGFIAKKPYTPEAAAPEAPEAEAKAKAKK